MKIRKTLPGTPRARTSRMPKSVVLFEVESVMKIRKTLPGTPRARTSRMPKSVVPEFKNVESGPNPKHIS
jgi:hypothetical protein